MDDAQRQRMAEMSGENEGGKFPKYVTPILSFNGNTGEFKKVTLVEKGENLEETLAKPVKIVFLKTKKALAGRTTGKSWFTSEYASPMDTISLFEVVAGKVVFAGSGPVGKIRELNPLLKQIDVAYVLFDGEVHKLEIKGASLSPQWAYKTALRDDGLHAFEVFTLITTEKKKNEELGNSYYAMVFTKDLTEVDLNLVEAKQAEVTAALVKIDAYQASKQSTNPTVARTVDGAAEEYNQLGKQDINPDDIPF